MSQVRRVVAVLVLGPVLAACAESTPAEPPMPSVRVSGTVLLPSGLPAARARVELLPRSPGCDGRLLAVTDTETDATGRYRGGFPSVFGAFSGCVELRVTLPGEVRPTSAALRDSVRVVNVAVDTLVLNARLGGPQ